MGTVEGLWQRFVTRFGINSNRPSNDQREDSLTDVVTVSSSAGVVIVDPAVAVKADVCCGQCGGGKH